MVLRASDAVAIDAMLKRTLPDRHELITSERERVAGSSVARVLEESFVAQAEAMREAWRVSPSIQQAVDDTARVTGIARKPRLVQPQWSAQGLSATAAAQMWWRSVAGAASAQWARVHSNFVTLSQRLLLLGPNAGASADVDEGRGPVIGLAVPDAQQA